MLQIGWVDFSKEHRKRVLNVLSLLTQKGAVDELGIGVIRDRLADILFPGTSTIHTRAKYFFIVPWIMSDLEKQNLKPDLYLAKLVDAENKMINVLKTSGGEGIIGEISGERLKRKPSEIYWNALQTYGIFRHYGLNMSKYTQIAGQLNEEKISKKMLLKSDDGAPIDDRDAFGMSKLGPSWNIIEPPVNWQTNLDINLRLKEAQFLKEKIITSPGSRNSLWANILKDYSEKAKDVSEFMQLAPFVKHMSEKIQTDYKLALDFSRLINGAHIRFNVIFFRNAEDKNQQAKYEKLWQVWVREMHEFNFSGWDTKAFLYRLNVQQDGTKVFVTRWVDYAKNAGRAGLAELDSFITRREEMIKGRERSKLYRAKELASADTKSMGIIGHLQYRWPNARRILRDIIEGLAS